MDTQMSDVAERFYPSPKIKGSDRKCQAATAQERHSGATARPRSGWQPRGAITHLRSGAAARRSNPTSKERWLCGHRRADRSYSAFKVRRGSCEQISLVQGKEQRLCFAEAAMKEIPNVQGKRNPGKMVGVARGIRRQTHKP